MRHPDFSLARGAVDCARSDVMATGSTHGVRAGVRDGGAGLLERDLELRKVDDAIAGAGDGSGRVMVFEGVAGIGKTALLAAAGQRAEAAGMRLLSAAGRELEQGFAFGVATQLLEPEVIALDAAEHERAFAGAAAPAASMLGGGSASAPAPDAGFSIIHALYWLIANLAETRPLVLIVDDLQWVDLPSREAVAYLTSRLDELPVFLACAVRTGDPDTDARELARSAAQEGFGGADADVEALRGLTPRGVSRAVLPRIRALGPAARAVSESVAVLEQAQLRHVAALASVAESQTVGAVDRLAEAGILADGLPLRYAHPILRTAVYRDLSSAAREHAHHRAAALLAEAGDD